MKLKEKFKDGRFIAKMVATAVLSAGIVSTCGGIYAAHTAVENNEIKSTEDAKYIAGVIATTLGAGAMSCGFASLVGNDDEDKKEDKEDTLNK